MEDAEREAIRAYKKYAQKHLSKVKKLDEYYVRDFHKKDYPRLDKVDAVKAYLDELRPFARVLSRAAYLRQRHYQDFIKDEDDGHKHWRLGLNAVAADANSKIDYYTHIHESLLSKAIDNFSPFSTPALRKSMQRICTIPVPVDEISNKPEPKTVVLRPRITKAERKARQQAQMELENEIMETAFDEIKQETNRIQERVHHLYTNVVKNTTRIKTTEKDNVTSDDQYMQIMMRLLQLLLSPLSVDNTVQTKTLFARIIEVRNFYHTLLLNNNSINLGKTEYHLGLLVVARTLIHMIAVQRRFPLKRAKHVIGLCVEVFVSANELDLYLQTAKQYFYADVGSDFSVLRVECIARWLVSRYKMYIFRLKRAISMLDS